MIKVPTQSSSKGNLLYISVGVSVSVIVLIVAVIIITIVTTKKVLVTADNVAYGVKQEDNLTDNLAYSATTSGEDGPVYDYIITADDDDINNIASTPNEAYGMTSNVST